MQALQREPRTGYTPSQAKDDRAAGEARPVANEHENLLMGTDFIARFSALARSAWFAGYPVVNPAAVNPAVDLALPKSAAGCSPLPTQWR